MLYQAIREGLSSKPTLIDKNTTFKPYTHQKDFYSSLFFYDESHKRQLEEKGTLAGIANTATDRLYFDFDSKDDLELARRDAIDLIRNLDVMNVPLEGIAAYFTGSKGFSVEVSLDRTISQAQFRSAVFQLAAKYSTFDRVVNDPNRIIRVVNTKHPKSGMFKIQLKLEDLRDLSIEDIKDMATSPKDTANIRPVSLPDSLFAVEEKPANKTSADASLDFSQKAKGWSNCKWSLLNGNFKEGGRHYPILAIVATARNLNYPKDTAYYMAKSAAKRSNARFGGEEYDKKEIWRQVEDVYGPSWKGGSFSCKDGKSPWLTEICNNLGPHKCKHEEIGETKPIKFQDLAADFKAYVKNIDKNTITTGLADLDANIFLSTGANVGIIGAPGSGKTSVGLEILNHTSKNGVRSVVASLDMAKNRIFEKIMYRLSGASRKELYETFQQDKEGALLNKLNEEFGNVNFFKRSSPTVQDIKEYVLKCNEEGPTKIKLVVVDYFERITSDFSDDTAASKKISGELQDLVDELDICLITLVQPNKHAIAAGPDTPIYDYTKIKGSSFVYQAFRIIVSCWRPYYNPKDFSSDHYMQMAVLKNDLGELGEMVFNWEGKKGFITHMEDSLKDDFYFKLKQREEAKPKRDIF